MVSNVCPKNKKDRRFALLRCWALMCPESEVGWSETDNDPFLELRRAQFDRVVVLQGVA